MAEPDRRTIEAAELRAALLSSQPAQFVSHQLLDRTPWVFPDHPRYVEWKTVLAEGLNVDPHSIIVVGSACTGYSLNPRKMFSRFHIESDIDVAIVSSRHFEEAWRWLRELGPAEALTKRSLEKEMLEWHRRNLVFDGTIATDRLVELLPFGSAWVAALAVAGNREPVAGHTVKARIYRDFESLRAYHVKNVTKLVAELGD